MMFSVNVTRPAAHIDRPTAHATARPTEYPVDDRRPAGTAGPWRPTASSARTVAVAISIGPFPTAVGGIRR